MNIPNNDDNTLIPIYGDYMQLPPEEERVAHVLNEIDFGSVISYSAQLMY